MKGLMLNNFYFVRVWWSWKNWFWTVSTLWGCGGHEITAFEQFLLWEGVVVGVVVQWCWKNWFWTVSILWGCGGVERTDFEQFLLCEGVVVMKELILNSFYLWEGVVAWWCWKNWFWTVSTLGGSGGVERTAVEHFLLWEGVVVLKELISNSFYFGRVWWSWKNWFWTVSALGGVVVWWCWKNWIWTVSTLWGCGGRCGGVVVLKEHMGDAQGNNGDIQWGWLTYRGVGDIRACLNAWGVFKLGDVLMQPNIWGVNSMPQSVELTCHYRKSGVFKHMGVLRWRRKHGDIQGGVWTYGGVQASGWCPNACEHPNIWGMSRCPQTYGGVKSMPTKCKSYMPLKKIRGVWTYGVLGASGWCPNAWGHPNIWGCPDALNIWGCQVNAPKCKSYMPLKKIRGVWTYGGVGGIQMHGGVWTYGEVSRCPQTYGSCKLNAPKCKTYMALKKIREKNEGRFFKYHFEKHIGVLGVSGGCPNALGHPNIWGCSDIPQIYGSCKLNAPKV